MKLADVSVTRAELQPGDRIIVRLRQPLTKYQKDRLMDSIQNWAGVPLRILLIDETQMGVEIDRAS